MSEEYLTEQDLAIINDIVEDDVDAKHGQHILAAVAHAEDRYKRGDDPVLEILRRAHAEQAEESDQQ
jgi:hypothetical protein